MHIESVYMKINKEYLTYTEIIRKLMIKLKGQNLFINQKHIRAYLTLEVLLYLTIYRIINLNVT